MAINLLKTGGENHISAPPASPSKHLSKEDKLAAAGKSTTYPLLLLSFQIDLFPKLNLTPHNKAQNHILHNII